MSIVTEARNATIADLASLLQAQHAAKADAVIPATNIVSRGGILQVKGMGTENVVFGMPGDYTGAYLPTAICDGQIADKLGIPVRYLRTLRETRPDLYDANVNGWLHGRTKRTAAGETETIAEADARRFLLRGFHNGDDGGTGIARALLSDSYKPIDNLDVLMTVLQGINDSGTQVDIVDCQLSETRMTVNVAAPELAVLAPELLKGYVSPNMGWTLEQARAAAAREGKGYEPGKEPVVFAGFTISNSETGGGAFTITPRIVVRICKNGLTMTKDVMRTVHLGGKLEDGQVRWGEDTQRTSLELVQMKARDAVKTFLDVDYVRAKVAELEVQAGIALPNPVKTVEVVSKTLRFSEATQAAVLDHFIRGGQVTAGGVMQAITAHAQDDAVSPDLAYDLEAVAVQAMALAAVHA